MSSMQSKTGGSGNVNYSDSISYNKNRYALNWVGVLRFTAPTVGLMAVLGGLIALTLGSGCASKKTGLDASSSNISTAATASDSSRASALDVSPPATSAYVPSGQPPAYVPPAPDPVVTQAPTLAASTSAGTGVSTGGSNYTVQHGDTLFRIAKEHYGDGKQWKRIASANPGLTPAKLRTGQTIILP